MQQRRWQATSSACASLSLNGMLVPYLNAGEIAGQPAVVATAAARLSLALAAVAVAISPSSCRRKLQSSGGSPIAAAALAFPARPGTSNSGARPRPGDACGQASSSARRPHAQTDSQHKPALQPGPEQVTGIGQDLSSGLVLCAVAGRCPLIVSAFS